MYSETDLDSAVAAGVLNEETARALRAHISGLRSTPLADEEQFRLITGFNDIFVTIACALVIFAAAAVGGTFHTWLGGGLVALASWLMAEFFTRKRRMALPSIVLLMAFVVGTGVFAMDLAGNLFPKHQFVETYQWEGQPRSWERYDWYPWQQATITGIAAVAAALAAFVHWRRFKVAITIAAGVGALVLLVLAGFGALTNKSTGNDAVLIPTAFVAGLIVFAYAMRWDLTDTARRTINADIAFWLHLLAAPLIAHPLFHWMGVTNGEGIGSGTALGVLAIYVLFAVVALAVDRRALLVSALAYVLIALGQLFRNYGAVELNVALTALVIGSALLMLSAFWAPIRSAILAKLPAAIRDRLPSSAVLSPAPA